jgi:hypothetical protein
LVLHQQDKGISPQLSRSVCLLSPSSSSHIFKAQVGDLALAPKGETDEEFPSEVIHRLVGLKQLQVGLSMPVAAASDDD